MKPISKQPLPEHAKKVFSGIVFDVYQWEQQLYDGSVKTFEKLKRNDTVLVVMITEEGEFVLTLEEQPGKQAFYGFVGGRVEEGEEPMDAAHRELLEETGFKAESLELIEASQPITKVEWSVYTYVARGCKKVSEQTLDGGEKIELKFCTLDEWIAIVSDDAFTDRAGDVARLALCAKYNEDKKEELKKLLG